MQNIWATRFGLIRSLARVALAGLPFALLAFLLTSEHLRVLTALFALALFLPVIVYTWLTIFAHARTRYRGRHPDLWGAILLIESSGWMKLVYLFRHLLPDMRRSGRYKTS